MTGPLVIIGDTLLDRDVQGDVSRLCPDGPAPVLDERAAVDRPGGAGLAAALAAADGREVILVTGLADDPAGARLSTLLAAAGVQVYPLRLPGTTTEKIRLRTGRQTLLRLDRGGADQPPEEPSETVLDVLGRAGTILVSDYGRGVRPPAGTAPGRGTGVRAGRMGSAPARPGSRCRDPSGDPQRSRAAPAHR